MVLNVIFGLPLAFQPFDVYPCVHSQKVIFIYLSLFFCLFICVVNQEPGTPELQIYEIPLDSLGQQRVYIGTKRVAPKTDEHKERTQVAKFTKNKKHRKKDRHEFQGNTLPRAGRRDHIYSSVNDEVNSALSEGMSEYIERGYFMAAQGYDFYLRVLKVSLTSERYF